LLLLKCAGVVVERSGAGMGRGITRILIGFVFSAGVLPARFKATFRRRAGRFAWFPQPSVSGFFSIGGFNRRLQWEALTGRLPQ
jgi:hypothetical protein